ncbi:sulfur carrier protein ThiS [Xanthobacter sp. TB0139]|uniref:sulfur carrier protein ThiS n=1 Tax=Xanthobacter sp. TB0139 TaxID=3459178 RepID=UPI00403A227B
MLSLKVNGEEIQLAVKTVADLLQSQQIEPERKGIAVALNGAVVPRRNWAQTILADSDTVEIITARQGG